MPFAKPSPPKRLSRWQWSLASLLGLVTLAALVSAWFQPERPPPPIEGRNELETAALALAAEQLAAEKQAVEKRAGRLLLAAPPVPIAIEPLTGNGAYLIRYWTPARELRLLGHRIAIVDLRTRTVEIPLRE